MMRAGLASLLGVALALVAVIAIELDAGDRSLERSGGAGPPSAAHATTPATASAVARDHVADWVETILARPLFSPSRRPPSVATAGLAAEIIVGLPRLAGILVSPAGKRAIFAAGSGGKPLIVAEGDSVGKWTVRAIESSAVTLTGPDGARVLHTSFQNSTAPAQPAQPASITGPTSLAVTDPAALLRRSGQEQR
jgi:hypothetical protein